MDICCETSIPRTLNNFWIERLAEVDDAVIQLAIALIVVAHSASLVLVCLLRLPHVEVPHVVLLACLANLKVVVAMDFENL